MRTLKNFLSEPVTYILGYFLMAIFTFGHAYHQSPKQEQKMFAGQSYTVDYPPPLRAFEGIFAAAMWPLYWSVQLQEPK